MRHLLKLRHALLMLLCGCQSETVVNHEEVDGVDAPSWNEFKERSTYVDDKGNVHYIVEGDIAVSLPRLRQYYDRRYVQNVDKSSVWVDELGNDVVFSSTDKLNITYCVSNLFGTNKTRAVADMAIATSQWMSAANVVFTYVPGQDSSCTDSNTGVRLNVQPMSGGGLGCAPYDCRFLKMDYNEATSDWGTYSWLGTWTHETGHTLGLAHEHESQPCGSGSGQRIINSYDISSSMHYDTVCGSPSIGQMTALDAAGVSALYGASTKPYLAVLPTEWILEVVL